MYPAFKCFSSSNLGGPEPRTPSKPQAKSSAKTVSKPRPATSRVLRAPYCLLEKARVGSHFEFQALEKTHLLELDLKKFQFYSLGRLSQLRTSFESAKRVGFEDIDVIDQKFQTLQKLSLRRRSQTAN